MTGAAAESCTCQCSALHVASCAHACLHACACCGHAVCRCCTGAARRGVAVISRLCMMRTEPASPDSSQAGSPARCQEPGGQPQPHQLQLWPAWGEACGAQPLLQHALQLALPREQLALQLLVQPSTRPAELLMLCKGEVRCCGSGSTTVACTTGGRQQVVGRLAAHQRACCVSSLRANLPSHACVCSHSNSRAA